MTEIPEYDADREPIALAYETDTDILLAELYTKAVAAECDEASWIRVEWLTQLERWTHE